ncbi:unnamed protein product [Cercospora beticola]|nr:unnamed protein product [Cercospora beticola]
MELGRRGEAEKRGPRRPAAPEGFGNERACGGVLRAGWQVQAGSREKTGRANRRLGRVGRTIGKKKATARTHALQVRLVDFQWMDHDQVRAPPMEPRIALPRFPS